MADFRHLLNPFSARNAVLHSRLAPAECGERLRPQIVRWRFPDNLFVRPKGAPLFGEVLADRFSVAKYTPYFRNSFRPVAMGRLEPAGDGTRIEVRIGLHPTALAFMIAFLAFVVWIGALALRGGESDSDGHSTFMLVAIAPFVLLFGGRAIGQGEETFLVRHLAETFEATVDPPGALVGQW